MKTKINVAKTNLTPAVVAIDPSEMTPTQLRETITKIDEAATAKYLAERDTKAHAGLMVRQDKEGKVVVNKKLLAEAKAKRLSGACGMSVPAKAVKEKTPKKEKVAKAEGDAPKAKKARTTGGVEKTPAERRAMVVAAMIKMGATGATTGRTADEIAAACGLTRFDVYGQLYHTHKLQTEGHVKQVKMEGARSLTYFLTAKGVKAKGEIA